MALPAFQSDFHFRGKSSKWVTDTTANMTSIFVAGCAFGSIIAWPLMEQLGRLRPLQIGSVIFIAGAVAMSVPTGDIAAMYAGRVLTGVGVGNLTAVIPTFIAEQSPPGIRGQLTGFFDVAYQVGALVGFWVIYGIKSTLDVERSIAWRIPMAIQLIPIGIFGMGTFFLNESPAWLFRRGRDEEAMKVLSYLRNLPTDHTYILEEVGMIHAVMAEEARIAGEQNGLKAYLRGATRELRQPSMQHRIILIFWIYLFMTWSGALSMNYYSPSIFASVGIKDTALYTGIYGVFKALGAITFFLFIIDRAGRRVPWLISSFICTFCLIYLAIYVKLSNPGQKDATGRPIPLSNSSVKGGKAAISVLMFYSMCWGFGGNGLPWVVSSEMIPVSLRSVTGAYASFCHWITSFAVLMVQPYMKNGIGWAQFLVYAMVNVCTFVFTFIFIPDTKGIPIECMGTLFGGATQYSQWRQKKVYPPHGVPRFPTDLVPDTDQKAEEEFVERV